MCDSGGTLVIVLWICIRHNKTYLKASYHLLVLKRDSWGCLI